MKKIIILFLCVTSISYTQFRFTRSLPDCFYKAVILCENENISDISKDGWGGAAYNPYKENNISKFGEKSVGLNLSGYVSAVDILYNSYYNPLAYGNDFTIEMWIYNTTATSTCKHLVTSGYNNQSAALFFILNSRVTVHGNFNNIWMGNYNTTTGNNTNTVYYSSDNTVPLNNWTHLCNTRKGNTVYYFINGKLLYSCNATQDFNNNNPTNNYDIRIGQRTLTKGTAPSSNSQYFIGYIQNIKFSTIARYTSDFNPTKPY